MSYYLSFSIAFFIPVVAFAAQPPSPKLSTSLSVNVTRNIDDGEFYALLLIGNTLHSLALDTDSDLIWTDHCNNKVKKLGCSSDLCEKTHEPCDKTNSVCQYTYISTNHTPFQVDLATENFNFDRGSVSKLVFSCGRALENEPGGLGLGRGPLSLVSQTNTNTFSYCLPSYDDPEKNGFLLVGSPPKSLANMINASLVDNIFKPSPYYMSIEGISVNNALLKIPTSAFKINDTTGDGGIIMDTGSTLTYLDEKIYDPLLKKINKTIHPLKPTSSPMGVGLTYCFSIPRNKKYKLPLITIHFSSSSSLTLSPANTFRIYNDPNTKQNVSCLAIARSIPSDKGMSRIGNMQQLNTVVFMDLANQMVGFIPNSECDTMSYH